MAYDPIKELERLRDMQKQQATLNLDKSRQSALSNLQSEEQKIKPMYYNKRNEASTQSQLGGQNTAEFLAARGLTNSGSAAQAELNRGNQLQNTLNQYNTQENQMFGDIARRRTQVGNEYENELAKAYNTIEMDYAQKLMAEKQRQAEIERQAALARQRAAAQKAAQEQTYKNTYYKNDNQKGIYDYGMGKNTSDSWGTRMKKLYQASEDTALSPEDRAFANAQAYATRMGNYYNAAYDNYLKNRK